MKKPWVNLSLDEFIANLNQEYEYHKRGGTEYRQHTAKLSLEIALKVKKVHPFLDPVESKKLVYTHLPDADNERKHDVAKMLRVTAKSMYLEMTTPEEVKGYVKSKLKNNWTLKK
ncbi:hypothetical protein [Virgibacillus sp. YIM 98842]|uniref:hypothetical protein n=1 Tax=Virgibacillus sp. YIM 98842 TaxID=2663533 RepID=UPI0013DB9F8A|nr:hypothetical protein [Virgibacillus sp. YIM 98842]